MDNKISSYYFKLLLTEEFLNKSFLSINLNASPRKIYHQPTSAEGKGRVKFKINHFGSDERSVDRRTLLCLQQGDRTRG